MAGKPNKTAIGVFVLGAVALTFAVILLYGGTRFFTEEYIFVSYFDGSVKGLDEGSPVMFRGVRIGSVEDISITVVPSDSTLKIPVVFTLEPAKFGGAEVGIEDDRESIQKAVDKYGLRTQLRTMNFLTGKLMVALDFLPGSEAVYVGISEEYPEIPSVPTTLDQLQQTVEDLPLREMIENLNSTVARIDRLLESLENRQTLQNVETAVADFQDLVRNIDTRVDPLMENLTKTAEGADDTFAEVAKTSALARESIEELKASALGSLDSAQTALDMSEQVMQNFTDDSRLVTEMTMTLREFSETARSFRRLTDYLERHPEALLRGKSER